MILSRCTAILRVVALASVTLSFAAPAPIPGSISLEQGFLAPPLEARPHTYWLWLNGYVDSATAADELRAMKEAGLGGVLLFEMGARGDKATIPPPGPAFLSPAWVKQLRDTTEQAKSLGLQVDMSVISSWDLGGPWIEPRHASMGLYATEMTLQGGATLDVALPFPTPERAAPLGADGRPSYWTDVAVLAVREPRRLPAHEFILRLDPTGVHQIATVVLDQGRPNAPVDLASTMTPVREFSVAVSERGTREADFTEVLRTTLSATEGPQRFTLPADTRAQFVRLRLLSAHDDKRERWTLGEFEVLDAAGRNLAGSHTADQTRSGALMVRAPVPLTYTAWSTGKLNDGLRVGAGGVFSSAGRPSFDISDPRAVVNVTAHVDGTGRLRWDAPPGAWTILRYVCMVTGEKLKVPSPASDGLASDHLSAEATRIHMNHVIGQLRAGLGENLATSGINNLYLASYEVVGKVWSPGFAGEFKRRRGYDLISYLPAVFGARIGEEELTERFLFDYQKTLGEVVVDAYYRTAVEVAHAAGLKVKSEAGGPGPPIHTPPMDALLAQGAVDSVQGEFWPFWPDNDAINVIKEPASAAHIYGKPIVHLESFTSFQHWAEGPQDLKPSADRVFCEGGNHFVWHTWTHQPPEAGLPGLVYGAGTHLSRSVTWWPKAKPFLDYLARGSFLLQRGRFVADVLYYYGDGGANFVGPRKNPDTLGPGYDYDVTNADVILRRLGVRDGRVTLPEGTSYAVLVLPDREDIQPDVLAKIETLVQSGATLLGRKPTRASGLEGFPGSDARVREIAGRIWADLNGTTRTSREYGRGRVYTGVPERHVLTTLGLSPDFTASPALDFIHRNDPEGDIYFVRNRSAAAVTERVTFRAGDRAPEFWDPLTGRVERAPVYRRTAGGIEVPLTFPPYGSTFVVFRAPLSSDAIVAVSDGAVVSVDHGVTKLSTERNGSYQVTRANGRTTTTRVANLPGPIDLSGEWMLEFKSPVGAPAKITLPHVGAWTKQASADYRYFSGSGTYRKTFKLPSGWRKSGQRTVLDLGHLWTIGEVWLNGKSLGVVWTSPFKADCTDLLREGENDLVVEVVNTWHNRLVGDARGPVEARVTRTNIAVSQRKPWKDLEPIESGLFGPVRLFAVAVEDIRE